MLPKPAHPLDVWLGGKAPSELRRVGRLGDGWLASLRHARAVQGGRASVIEDAADAAGRAIDPEHFGVMVFYTHDEIPDAFAQVLASRNPDVEPDDLVARGWPAVREHCASATSRSASRSWCSSRSPNPRTGTTSSRRARPSSSRSRPERHRFEEAAEADHEPMTCRSPRR